MSRSTPLPHPNIVAGAATLHLPVANTVFVGCSNEWGRTSYWKTGNWSIELEAVRSTSTCGSPVVSSGRWWAGFLCEGPGTIDCDGQTVTLRVPAAQELLLEENLCDSPAPWELYRRLAESRLTCRPMAASPAPHWREWEFCTWVEQKAAAGSSPRAVLDNAFVQRLAERLLRLGLPPGKFTIDDGWQQTAEGGWNDGHWRPDTRKFPDLARTCRALISAGFTPGLWFGLPCLPANALLRDERPELFGSIERFPRAETAPGESPWSLATGEETEAYVRETLRPYAEMGFRKFKFDFYYGARARMNALARTVHHAVRALDPTIEIESHHPDFFFSRWIDACRLNDVLIQPGWDWEGLTLAHMRIAHLCAPDRIMNLDHLGGNDPAVCEADCLRHLAVLDLAPREQPHYAVLSLLPDRFSTAARTQVRDFVLRHRRTATG